jgi:hypothetical protein
MVSTIAYEEGEFLLLYEVRIAENEMLTQLLEGLTTNGTRVRFCHNEDNTVSVVKIY